MFFSFKKLTQVLGYLRADPKKRKQRADEQGVSPQKEAGKPSRDGAASSTTASNVKIFDDVEDYAPSRSSTNNRRSNGDGRDRQSYFDDGRGKRDDRLVQFTLSQG